MPAPKPPADAREAAKAAEAEAAQSAGDSEPGATAPDEAGATEAPAESSEPAAATAADGEGGTPAAAPPSTLTVLRDGVPTEVDADEDPKKGYERAKVAISRHLYYVDYLNANNEKVKRHVKADRGAILELPADEIERGRSIEALVDVDEVVPEVSLDPLTLDDEQLAAWVDSHKVDEVVALATSVEAANRIFEAERATQTDPRVGVLRGIEAALNSGRV